MISVPLLDLKPQYQALKSELDAVVAEVVESQYFILGPTVENFEQACASYCNTEQAIGVSSGTDALIVAMMAMGIGEGDEVITTPYTFFGTVGSIVRLGAKPVFVDIEPDTFNIDASKIEAAITDKTRAIAPVHLFGQMADMPAIKRLAREHDLLIIEDAAQAIGSKQNGRLACSRGILAACLSSRPRISEASAMAVWSSPTTAIMQRFPASSATTAWSQSISTPAWAAISASMHSKPRCST